MRLLEERRGSAVISYVYEPGSYVPLARLDAEGERTEQGGLGSTQDVQQPQTSKTIAASASQSSAGGQKHPNYSQQPANDTLEASYWQALNPKDTGQSTGTDGPSANANLCEVYYFHTDQVGLPEELSNAQGQIIWQAQYKTWGSTIEERWEARRLHGAKVQGQTEGDIPRGDRQEQNLRFQGQYLDRETGLHYNTFRYYDADIGRFISPDPIGLEGGINLGSYSPNPISWIDPWGWSCGAATKPIKFKRWKPGDAIDKPLPDGRSPTWDVVRSRYWKNRAAEAPKGEFSRSNIERMRRGSAPLDKNGNSMELHHHNPQRHGGANVNNPYNLREVTREQHAALDAYRNLGKN